MVLFVFVKLLVDTSGVKDQQIALYIGNIGIAMLVNASVSFTGISQNSESFMPLSAL